MQTSANFVSSCRARTRFCSGQSGTTTAQLQSITQKRSRFTRCHKATGSCGRVVRACQWMCLRRQERQGVDSPKQDELEVLLPRNRFFCLQLPEALQDCRIIGFEFLQVRRAAGKCFATVVRAPCLSLEQMLQRCHI